MALDYFNQVQQVELIYYITHPNGNEERQVQAFPMRYLFRFEAEHLLERCGFKIEELYADYDRSMHSAENNAELIFICSKH